MLNEKYKTHFGCVTTEKIDISSHPDRRTEYWKSQDRKYCDFCKCWITDNKPSVQFHENGKRHKENVAKKISELSKKSVKAHKESQKIDEEMKKMEEAALKAYMKDIESNPDFTSQQYKKIQEEKASAREEEIKEIVKKVVEKTKEPTAAEDTKQSVKKKIGKAQENQERTKPPEKKKLWYEAKSGEGYTYYWNSETNVSVWEPPEEGFISIEDQQKEAQVAARLKEKQENEEKEISARLHENKVKEASEETRAFLAREAMKKYRKEEEKEPPPEFPAPILGPTPKVDPYGSWTKVERVDPSQIDWQLPETPRIEVPQVVIREPQIKIKEKKMASLDDHDSNVSPVFKKRKPNPGRGNIRQRLDDD